MQYADFLESRRVIDHGDGFTVDEADINPQLFDFQRAIVAWACEKGRAAIFADTGLGKTAMQLEWARLVCEHTGGDVLLLAPLAVSGQTIREAQKFGIGANYCRSQEHVQPGVTVTNYEMLDAFDASHFSGVVLDESSILKAYMGKRKRALVAAFAETPYKLACTATPSPNDHLELLNQSAFLGVMESAEALSCWFINDTSQTGVYRLKRHAVRDFWRWVSSWAVAIERPSDLGFSDEGFALPPLRVHQYVVETDPTADAVDTLFRSPELSATSYHKEKRISNLPRARKVAELVAGMVGPVAVWCETNYEADALTALIPHAVEVRGSESRERKERVALAFAAGEIDVLVSKPSIFGFGMNFQACHQVVMSGLSYSYESFYQTVRRFWRYRQEHAVDVHIVVGDGEDNIVRTLDRKRGQHEELKANMMMAIREAQGDLRSANGRRFVMDYERRTERGDHWTMVNADVVDEVRTIPDGAIDFSVFSPPFSGLYIYSDSLRDMGNCDDDAEFFSHFGFLTGELYRITRPGRLVALHCKQLVNYIGRDGASGLRDFRGDLIRAMLDAGFSFHSEVTIWTDPVVEMQRTKSHGLLYKQLRADSTFSRMGLPEYLCLFCRWPDDSGPRLAPVTHTKDDFPLEKWQEYASPVWPDIRRTDVLNAKIAREERDEKHICPLQLTVVRRAVELWTNPGDLVFSPFAGIGSEGYEAVKLRRRFLGVELKESYWRTACRNLREAEDSLAEQTLFAAGEP